MINILIIFFTVCMFVLYGISLKKNPLNTKKLVVIGMYCAISFLLYLIHFISYPQGGGIS